MARQEKEIRAGRGRSDGHFRFGDARRVHAVIGKAVADRSVGALRWDQTRGALRSERNDPLLAALLAALSGVHGSGLLIRPRSGEKPDRLRRRREERFRVERGGATFSARRVLEELAEEWEVGRETLNRLASSSVGTSWEIYRRVRQHLSETERTALDAAAISPRLRAYLRRVEAELDSHLGGAGVSGRASLALLEVLKRKARALGVPPWRIKLAEMRVVEPLSLLRASGATSRVDEHRIIAAGVRRESLLLKLESGAWRE